MLISHRRLLVGEHGDDHAVDVYPHPGDVVYHAFDFAAVGDAVVGADFVLFDIARIDADDKFRLVAQFLQEFDFRRLVETGQHARGVQVVEKFAAEFEIKLVELGNSFQNLFGLLFHIHLAVKSDFFHLFILASYSGSLTTAAMPVLNSNLPLVVRVSMRIFSVLSTVVSPPDATARSYGILTVPTYATCPLSSSAILTPLR